MKQAEVISIKRSEISPLAENPRDILPINQERLSQSLKMWGLVQPLVWNKQTGNLVGGHQRLAVMDRQNAAYDESGTLVFDYDVQVSVLDVTPANEKRICVALNNENNSGQWSPDKLASLLKSLADESSADQDPLLGTGFDAANVGTAFLEMGYDPPSLFGDEPDISDILDYMEDDVWEGQDFIEGQKELEKSFEASQDILSSLKDTKIKDAKDKFEKKQSFSQDSQIGVNLIFGTSEQAEVFLYALGIEDAAYIDGLSLCKAFGMDLPGCIEDYRKDLLDFGCCASIDMSEVNLDDHAKVRLQPASKMKKGK